MVSNKNIHRDFENSYNSHEQYPLEKFFIFTIYQNYTLALSTQNIQVIFSFFLKVGIQHASIYFYNIVIFIFWYFL